MNRNLTVLSRQLGALTSGVAVNFVISALQGILLARLLGLEDYGRYATLLALGILVSRLNDFGLPHAFVYYYRRSPNVLPALMRILGLNLLWCGAVAAVILQILSFGPTALLGVDAPSDPLFYWGYGLLLVAGTPLTILLSTLSASGNYSVFAAMNSFGTVAQTALIGLLALSSSSSLSAFIALAGLIQALTAGLLFIYLRTRQSQGPPEQISVREVYSFGLRMQWGVVMKLLSTRLELLVAANVLSPAQLGLYSLALSVRDAGLMPQSIYSAPLQNMIIDRNTDTATANDRSIVLVSLLLQTALSILMLGGVALVLPVIIPLLYGQAYVDAVIPAIIIFSSVIFIGGASICWIAYNAKGRPELTSLVLTVSGLVGPLLIYLLSSRYGLSGASIASVAAAAFTFIASFVVIIRLQHYTPADLFAALHRAPTLAAELIRKAFMSIRPRRRVGDHP